MSQVLKKRDIVQRYKNLSKKIVLHEWQEENVKFIEDNKFVLISDEMGLGKTFSALAAVKKNKLYPCLILCPKSLKINWYREIRRIDHYASIELLDGTKQKGVIKEPAQINGRLAKNYTILHYDSKKLIPILPEARSIILDEIHYLKGYKSQRTQVTQKYIREKSNATHVIGLSGTPILNRGDEIFTVTNVLHSNVDSSGNVPENQYDGSGGLLSWDEFYGSGDDKFTYTKYFNDRMIGYGIKPEKQVELNKLLKDRGIMMRHTKSLLENVLPKISKSPTVLPKPDGYQKELNQYGGMIKIAQLTLIRKWLAEQKVPDVVDHVTNIVNSSDDDKVIVFGNYIDATNRLGREIGEKLSTKDYSHPKVAITSETDSKDRQPIIDKFQSDPRVRVLVMTVRTGNVGLNLVEANHVVFNDYSYSPSDMMQAEARIFRLGQTKTTFIHYMSSQDTVDEDVLDVLTNKQNVINGIIDGVIYPQDSQQYKDQERGVENIVLGKLHAMIKSQKIKKNKPFGQKKKKNENRNKKSKI